LNASSAFVKLSATVTLVSGKQFFIHPHTQRARELRPPEPDQRRNQFVVGAVRRQEVRLASEGD
jgi:hypothetical protein